MDRQPVIPLLPRYAQYQHFRPYPGHQYDPGHPVHVTPAGHAFHEAPFYLDPGQTSRTFAAATPPPTQLHPHPHLHLHHSNHLPHSPHLQQQHQEQLHPHQQLSSSSSLAAGSFLNPNFRPRQHSRLSLRTRQHNHCAPAAMSYQAGGPTDDELAELQKLSSEYEPEVTGPLVGQRVPSTAITTEYANADPILQAKTANLPSKYAYYRTVRGDGRCGWRAIAFGYFEALARLGDPDKFLEEEGRLRSLSNIVRATSAAGFDEELINDIADEALTVMRRMADAVRRGEDSDAVLVELFTDEMVQNYVITYLKTLTTAWMKQRPEEYAPFLVGQTVQGYCDSQVMPLGAELENVSLIALKDVLVNPAAISLEVVYLDRSESSEVNTHRFDPTRGLTNGVIRLLYRPGHYDILYKEEDVPAPTTIPTYLQYNSEMHHDPAGDHGMSDFMSLIPGMSYMYPGASWPSAHVDSGLDFYGAPTPTQPWSHSPAATSPTPAPVSQIRSTPVPASSSHTAQNGYKQEPVQSSPELMNSGSGIFRRSRYEFEPTLSTPTQTPWQTNVFRDSPHNPCHFRNDDFQPELWDPEAELGYESAPKRHRALG